jgi:hypothetical protein
VYIRVTPQQSFNNDTVKLLICTKAAFGVSNKFVPYQWQCLGNRIRSTSTEIMARFDGTINIYVNKQQHRVIAEWNLTTKQEIQNGYSAAVLQLNEDELYLLPIADVYSYFTADDNSFLIRLGKNCVNRYGAFRMLNGTVPTNTEINMYMEWSYI